MKRIHLMGIGGVGMSGLALLLHKAGNCVSGCDKYSTPRTRWLEETGITFCASHSPDHLNDIDELIITPAIPANSPELSAARKLEADGRLKIRYRGEVLSEIVNSSYGIAICGTHGKTTTSTFTTKLLRAIGNTPRWCIGGETGTMPVAGWDAGNYPLIVEADESDGTLALYHPRILVLNAVDFDHLEHFDSEEAYFDCYRAAIRNTKDAVIVCAEHPKALELAKEAVGEGVKLITFGFSPHCDFSAERYPELSSVVLGRHNILNALAAIAVVNTIHAGEDCRNDLIGNDTQVDNPNSAGSIAHEILNSAFSELPDRRFQKIIENDSVTILTDYAHHPAELACAISMARSLKPKRLRVLFQPHRYSRTKALLNEFAPAFAEADEVVLIPVYAAFEEPLKGGDVADLYLSFRNYNLERNSSQTLLLARSADEAWKHAFLSRQDGDVILLAGAGDIINLLPKIRSDFSSLGKIDGESPRQISAEHRVQSAERRVQSAEPDGESSRKFESLSKYSFFRTGGVTCGGGARVIVGMGSNTWFSDLTDDIEIVKPDLPSGASLVAKYPQLAFMSGIPGTIGGWVKMNAGAFGHSIGEFVSKVKIDGKWIDHDQCGFAYRHSDITGVIEEVEFNYAASECGGNENHNTPADYLRRRKQFPARTCGSVFKNPSNEMPAGKLLEEAGAKEMRVGGASVWSEHANVIVAGDGCTSSDILALASLMRSAVQNKFKIALEFEIRGLD